MTRNAQHTTYNHSFSIQFYCSGYPEFYLGGRECVWSLVAAEGQTIILMLADLSLRR